MRLTEYDCLSLREMCEGMMVLGNPGSGKSSTTGTIVPLIALRSGWGIIAYCTKPDDAAFWARLCHLEGGGRKVRVIRPDGKTRFNLMQYELARISQGGGGGSSTLKLATLLFEVFKEGNALTTHLYHCTSGRTAEWIQKRIADAWGSTESVQIGGGGGGGGQGEQRPTVPSVQISERLHPQVLASELARLRTGGPLNSFLVDAIVLKPGRRFHASGGAPFARVQFQQSPET